MSDQKQTHCFSKAKSKMPSFISFERNFPLSIILIDVYSLIFNNSTVSERDNKEFQQLSKVRPALFFFTGNKCLKTIFKKSSLNRVRLSHTLSLEQPYQLHHLVNINCNLRFFTEHNSQGL